MAIMLQKDYASNTPNTAIYGIRVTSSIVAGKVVVVARCNIQPVYVDANGVYTPPLPGAAVVPKTIPDLTAYAVANPDLAAQVQAVWTAMDALVNAINLKEKLV